MSAKNGRKRFLDFAVNSGLTKKLPPSFWLSLAYTSENLLIKDSKKAIKELTKDPNVLPFDTKETRGYKGNLPFKNNIEAREWMSSVGMKNFAKESKSFSNMIKQVGVFANKNNLENKLNDADFIKSQDNSINQLKNIFEILQNEIIRNDNGSIDFYGIAFVGALLSSSSAGQNHFLRKAAPYRFYQKGYFKAGSSVTTLEHTMPATIVGKYLFLQAVEGSVSSNFKNIKNNYFQGPLLKYNDKKLKGKKINGEKFDYIATMPENWQVTDNVWARYFNLNVANTKGGINPSDIVIANNQTIFDKFQITASGFKISNNQKISYSKTSKNNSKIIDLINEFETSQNQVYKLNNIDEALKKARSLDTKEKGISVFDFDDTLARTKSKIIVNMPDGKTSKIDATEFAKNSITLEEQGAKFNFDEFNKVVDGKKGPLADLALKRQGKFGSQDIFVLTARPQLAAEGIKAFLDGIGLNLPLSNITGLEDGSPQAKANWVVSKAAEGYNNFYFADDAIKNVKAVQEVLDQVDVKSKVQIAKFSKTKTFDKIFNDILESSTGIESYKDYSSARAQTTGANKGKFTFFNTPSAEDFTGLQLC